MSTTHTTETSKEIIFDSLLDEPTQATTTKSKQTKLRKKEEVKVEPVIQNSIIDHEEEYLDADQLHEQLKSQGKGTDADIMAKLYQLEQVLNALTIKKGKLSAATDFVPVTEEGIIIHLNGGEWPKSRYVIYKNAKICLRKDIPHIKAMESLTTIDINQPNETGNLKAAEAL